jgi:hypothetical protein
MRLISADFLYSAILFAQRLTRSFPQPHQCINNHHKRSQHAEHEGEDDDGE